jgi:type IV secretory pathway TrbD component
MSELRETPIRKALYRPNLFLGGDRMLMLTALVISVGIPAASMNTVSFVFGFLIAAISVYGLRKMAKHDPMMWPVYVRFVNYRRYYAPYSRPSREATSRTGEY